jgi:Mn-dependent DtxR family transcriptional regulator
MSDDLFDHLRAEVDALSEDAKAVIEDLFRTDLGVVLVEDVAARLGWDHQRVYRALKEAEARGMIEGMKLGG